MIFLLTLSILVFHKNFADEIKSIVTWVDTSKKKQNMELEKIGNKFSNACEAQEVINLLKNISENETFIQSLLDEYERDSVPLIGIICMYAEQKKLILQKLKPLIDIQNQKLSF